MNYNLYYFDERKYITLPVLFSICESVSLCVFLRPFSKTYIQIFVLVLSLVTAECTRSFVPEENYSPITDFLKLFAHK